LDAAALSCERVYPSGVLLLWCGLPLAGAGRWHVDETEVHVVTATQEERTSARAAALGEGEQLVFHSSSLEGVDVTSRVLVAPWGEVTSTNGSFVVDEVSARAVVEAFRAHGTDLPIDYEHQTLGGDYASPTGQALAAGWIRSLHIVIPTSAQSDSFEAAEENDLVPGLYAEVDWTESAQQKLSAKEYRYLSPVVIVRKRDRRMVALHSAALTNKPAIVGMKPIVNRESRAMSVGSVEASQEASESLPHGLGHGVEWERDASDEEQMKMAETVRPEVSPKIDEAVEVLRMRLDLPAESDFVAVLAAVDDKLTSLQREVAEREARERVAEAMRAGKMAPSQREWAMSLALKDPAGFDEWMAAAPVVVWMGRTVGPTAEDGESTGRERTAVIASARASYRSEPSLALLTSESAWVHAALREAGFVLPAGAQRGS